MLTPRLGDTSPVLTRNPSPHPVTKAGEFHDTLLSYDLERGNKDNGQPDDDRNMTQASDHEQRHDVVTNKPRLDLGTLASRTAKPVAEIPLANKPPAEFVKGDTTTVTETHDTRPVLKSHEINPGPSAPTATHAASTVARTAASVERPQAATPGPKAEPGTKAAPGPKAAAVAVAEHEAPSPVAGTKRPSEAAAQPNPVAGQSKLAEAVTVSNPTVAKSKPADTTAVASPVKGQQKLTDAVAVSNPTAAKSTPIDATAMPTAAAEQTQPADATALPTPVAGEHKLAALVGRAADLGAQVAAPATAVAAKPVAAAGPQAKTTILDQIQTPVLGAKGETKVVAELPVATARPRPGGIAHEMPEISKQKLTEEPAAMVSAPDVVVVPSSDKQVGAVLSMLTGQPTVPAVAARAAAVAGGRTSAATSAVEPKARDTVEHEDHPVEALTLGKSGLPTEPVAEQKTFRFSSVREGRSTMDMIVGANADGKTSFETKKSSGGAAESIVVLDARRYLGFSQSPNGTALTQAISRDPEWTRAMQPSSGLSNAAAVTSTGKVVNTLKLQMSPVELGKVTATLRLVGEELSVHLTVETRNAHQQLSEDSTGILDALRSQGFQVDQVSVSIVSPGQGDAMQPPGADQGQRSSERHPDGSSTGQGQGQPSGRSSNGNTSGTTENENATDSRPGANLAGFRSGDLYL